MEIKIFTFSSSVMETLYTIYYSGLYMDTMLNLQDLACKKIFKTKYKLCWKNNHT